MTSIIWQGSVIASNPEEKNLIQKYKKWRKIAKDPKDPTMTFQFFSENPDWPLFFELTKAAEESINPDKKNDIILRWFQTYPPRTPNGTIAYCLMLLDQNKELGLKYINQTWSYQNLSLQFAQKFKDTFKKEITEISDAIRTRYLLKKGDKQQLMVMMKFVPKYIKKFIARHIKTDPEDHADHDLRYSKALAFSKSKKYKKAAEILISSNDGEESSPIKFFNLRRDVACNLAKSGHPLLAYKVISFHTLNKRLSKEKGYYVKSEWLAGFIAFRFLDDRKNGLRHFKNAYESSKDSLHKGKNAFWIGEVYLSLNYMISAFDWFLKAHEYPNTFYGQVAARKLTNISVCRFLSHSNRNIPISASLQAEKTFNKRELVQVIKAVSKHNIEKDIKFLSTFYKQLIDDIDDPNEEKLLMTLATTKAEIDFIIKAEADKQKYFSDRKVFRVLPQQNLSYIKKINDTLCFIGLVHAIIKRESMFNPKAQSYVGARGLMQIMPMTADYEMKKIKFYTGKDTSLFDVEKNLTIGSFLLNRLLKKYKNNLIDVMYAYNAGEGNLNKFKKSIKNLNGLTPLDEIELIPIKETRTYVKHALYNVIMYNDVFETSNCYNCQIFGETLL